VMDRDKRWDRVKITVDGLVKGVGKKAEDVVKVIEEKYKADETDEFLKRLIINGDAGKIQCQFACFLFFPLFGLTRWRYFILLQLPL
jgi:2,3-bisphosphoglycerate-independent phosphoglycerate mutase